MPLSSGARKWLKRSGLVLLGGFVLLVLLHRPILFGLARHFATGAAEKNHLTLTYEIEGTIFSGLTISNLKAIPTEDGPIKRLEVGTLALRYSLPELWRHGLSRFLQSVTVRDVHVVATLPEPSPEESAPPEMTSASPPKFPVLFPEKLVLDNINLRLHRPHDEADKDIVLEGFSFSLLPESKGSLQIQTLALPGFPRWTDLEAATSYRERNLILSDLSLGSEVNLWTLQLDLSGLDDGRAGIFCHGQFLATPVQFRVTVTDLNRDNHLQIQARVGTVNLESLGRFLNFSQPLGGRLEQLTLSFSGFPDRPRDWQGEATIRGRDLRLEQQSLARFGLRARFAEGRAHLVLAAQDGGKKPATLTATATAQLPAEVEAAADWTRTEAEGRLHLQIPEAARLRLPQPVSGDLLVEGDFTLRDGLLQSQLALDSRALTAADASFRESHFEVTVKKELPPPAGAPFFHALDTTLEGTVGAIQYRDYEGGTLAFKVHSQDDAVTLEQLTLTQKSNSLHLTASTRLPADGQSWADQTVQSEFSVQAPHLQEMVVAGSSAELRGELTLSGHAEIRNHLVNGGLVLKGRNIQARGVSVQSADLTAEVTDNRAALRNLAVVFDEQNHLTGSGSLQWGHGADSGYSGQLEVKLPNLAIFQPLLPAGPEPTALGGALNVSWRGQGRFDAPEHSGTAKLELTNGVFGPQEHLAAHGTISYGPDQIRLPDFQFRSDLVEAGFALLWQNNELHLSDLQVRKDKNVLLEGSLQLPLRLGAWPDRSALIPADEPLRLVLKTPVLPLADLLPSSPPQPPPLSGTVALQADLHGPLNALQGQATLKAEGLQSPSAETLAPARVDLDLVLKDNLLTVDGSLQQKRLQPLRLSGTMPIPVPALVETGQLPPETPLDFELHLPRTSLDLLSALLPSIRQSRGNAAIDVTAGGTIADPTLHGSITARLDTLRFSDPMLPPVDGFDLQIDFTPQQVTFTRCQGGIAGGTFGLNGTINPAPLNNPTLDLHFRSEDALVLQDDAVTVRADSDLQVRGPLQGATASGTIGITRSRFFKNIEILPIGLPGRPAPDPPEEIDVPGFPDPPLRDWKFDIRIRTVDPFLVQGNLANGRIVIDLHLGGTGQDPWMDGRVRIRQLTASLPFSQLQIESGEVFFTRQRPFVPQLNIDATSRIQEYRINIGLSGPVTDPRTFFTSEPPLTQAQVVSLIATGATPGELADNPAALAARGTWLLVKEFYNRVFNRNPRPSSGDSFLDQIQFNIAATDPQTGRQATTVGFPLTKNLMLTGGMNVGGDFQGQVKYLIRFR